MITNECFQIDDKSIASKLVENFNENFEVTGHLQEFMWIGVFLNLVVFNFK